MANNQQLWKLTTWGGMDVKDHPAMAMLAMKMPQKASEMMIRVFAANRGKTLESFLSQFPTKTFDRDDEFFWEIIGSSRRNIPLAFAVDENGNEVNKNSGNVGIGTAPFYLYFEEEYFYDGDYIVGNMNELYQIRILGDAIKEGTYVKYRCECGGGNTTGIPANRLLPGEKFSYEANFVEDDISRKVGDINHATHTAMKNEFSTIRLQHKVGGALIDDKLAVPIPIVDDKGNKKVVSAWMQRVDWEFEQKFAEAKNNALAYGVSNKTPHEQRLNIGKSGRPIKTGDGLYAQMSSANKRYYNTFSLKLIEEILCELSTSKLGFNDRTFILQTGERGAIQFHKAILNTVSGWQAFTTDGKAFGIHNTTSPLHSNALSAGFQFVEYLAPNGVKIKINVDPMYDDTVRNKIMHPNGGPAYSYRYDIFDIGSPEQQNIFKCAVKNRPEFRGYQCGPFANPFTGETDITHASYDEDSAVIHKKATLGICVLDPTRTYSIIPSILEY